MPTRNTPAAAPAPSGPTAHESGLDRALSLLDALIRDRGGHPLPWHARHLGLPLSTAYRLVAQLRAHGLLSPGARGYFWPGPAFLAMARAADPVATLAEIARPFVRRLARRRRAIVHLGVWEGDMVGYIVKESGNDLTLFTREGGQQEGYCSAVGRVLLAHRPEAEREAYLSAGPFVALTRRTRTEPADLRALLGQVAAQGHAVDDREIADDLLCVAVPVFGPDGTVIAALSLSSVLDGASPPPRPLAALRACADAITARLRQDEESAPEIRAVPPKPASHPAPATPAPPARFGAESNGE